ncbi:MAG: nucleotidyltransferase family protein [Bacteroidota bacterium]|jgi:predicted nucleotidyltransferase
MNLRESIRRNPKEFVNLCSNYEVKSLYAFGSSITSNFKEESSDIDLLVEINTEDPVIRGENILNLWDKLEAFFQRKVDLLTVQSIKNPILKNSIEATKMLIYDGKELKVSI